MFIGGPVSRCFCTAWHIGKRVSNHVPENGNVCMIAVSCPSCSTASARMQNADSMIGELSYPIIPVTHFHLEVMAKFAPYACVPSNRSCYVV